MSETHGAWPVGAFLVIDLEASLLVSWCGCWLCGERLGSVDESVDERELGEAGA